MELKLSQELYKSSGIYCITNSIDKRLYVGSALKLKKRYNDHKQNLIKGKHQSPHLQNFVKKYGIDKNITQRWQKTTGTVNCRIK